MSENKNNNKREYAFVMVRYDIPQSIQKIQDDIPDDILYKDENLPNYYGKEEDHHVTVAACLENNTDVEKIKKLLKPIGAYVAYIKGISIFNHNPNYDVVKCDIISQELMNTNKKILSEFESYSEFKDEYHPHLTLAYVKKGHSSDFTQSFDKLIEINPKSFLYSWVDNGKDKQISFEK